MRVKGLIFIFLLLLCTQLFGQWTPPSGYTPFMKLRLYPNGANPGADSLNANLLDIDRIVREHLIEIDTNFFLIRNDTLFLNFPLFTFFNIKTTEDSFRVKYEYQMTVPPISVFRTRVYFGSFPCKRVVFRSVFGLRVENNIAELNARIALKIGNNFYFSQWYDTRSEQWKYIPVEIVIDPDIVGNVIQEMSILIYYSVSEAGFVNFYVGSSYLVFWSLTK